MSIVSSFNSRQVFHVITAMTVLLVMSASASYAGSSATSHIGITKLATLQVAHLETDRLFSDQSGERLQSETCLQTGGEPMPYRMSASSLKGRSAFHVSNQAQSKQIGYQVIWSGKHDKHRLSASSDVTDVIQAESRLCDNHMLSIEWDHDMFAAASSEAYTDTLSLMFVIE